MTKLRRNLYLISDPFNDTYNPSHLVEKETFDASVYESAFEEAFIDLAQNGKMLYNKP